MKKKILLGVVLMVSCLSVLVGCGKGNTTKNKNNETKNESKEKITIDKLIYDVKSEVSDGERYVMMSLTNNSKYTLTDFKVDYKVKSDVTDKQKNEIYNKAIKEFEVSADDAKELKKMDISMFAETEKIVEPGETINKINCYSFEGYYCMKNMEHFKLLEPDIVTIKYIDDGKINTMYYDCSNKSYSYESETEPVDEWPKGELGKKIPKPDAKHITSNEDDDMGFTFDAYGLTIDDFNQYVEQCKESGYTENEDSHDGFYTADSKDGYNVRLTYYDDNDVIGGTVEKSEEK